MSDKVFAVPPVLDVVISGLGLPPKVAGVVVVGPDTTVTTGAPLFAVTGAPATGVLVPADGKGVGVQAITVLLIVQEVAPLGAPVSEIEAEVGPLTSTGGSVLVVITGGWFIPLMLVILVVVLVVLSFTVVVLLRATSL